jgi:hypothetical protein
MLFGRLERGSDHHAATGFGMGLFWKNRNGRNEKDAWKGLRAKILYPPHLATPKKPSGIYDEVWREIEEWIDRELKLN